MASLAVVSEDKRFEVLKIVVDGEMFGIFRLAFFVVATFYAFAVRYERPSAAAVTKGP
jgi:hypothetical protein